MRKIIHRELNLVSSIIPENWDALTDEIELSVTVESLVCPHNPTVTMGSHH